MKAIIEGKRYNTETSQQIASDWNGLSRSDFNYMDETLYRTENGNWFLHGAGGANTKYSEAAGNMRSGGESIIPMDEDGAYSWLERTNNTKALEEYFPDRIEDA
ncbi:MAG TPA: hypothetical protein VJ964_08970 [Balneolaceae bacterium]|nr:hypothetical protein [Balneolaceae bacterium]